MAIATRGREFASMLASHVNLDGADAKPVKPSNSWRRDTRLAPMAQIIALPPVVAPNHMAKPRDPRQVRYLQLKAQRISRAQLRAAKSALFSMTEHKWLSSHSLIPIPRKGLSTEQKRTLREAFDLMDRSGDGHIDEAELSLTMKSLGFTSEDIREAISSGDHDGDGTLDFEEVMRQTPSEWAPKPSRGLAASLLTAVLGCPPLHQLAAGCLRAPSPRIPTIELTCLARYLCLAAHMSAVLHDDCRAAAQEELPR